MKRNPTIDLMKTTSIILVILVHSLPRDIQMMIGRPLFLQHAVPAFMVLFGYNRVKSIERKGIDTLAELTKWDAIRNQLKGILIPYVVVWVIFELSFGLAVNANLIDMVQSFILGGRGPGGYFIVLMVQAILLFPFLYHFMNRIRPVKALTILFILNLGLELLSINMNPELYRVLIVRHIFSIALGIHLAKHKDKIDLKKWVPLVIVSLVYIISVDYGGEHLFIEHMWDSQHPPAYFWTFFMVFIGLSLPLKRNRVITFIGQSSYFVFLVQKVYFMFRNAFFATIPYGLDTLISLLISLTLGIGFYYLVKNNYFIDEVRKTSYKAK